jgi:predicted AAA+ superfamily ATPase
LTNPLKISKTFNSKGNKDISDKTVSSYINHFMDAFILSQATRYDIKGRKYIGSPFKFYFTDIGIRNAKLNFRQQEENHIMENIIYNELLVRGYNVDVGIVETFTKVNNKTTRVKYEIDFVCNLGSKRYYIQSAFEMATEEKIRQEERSLKNIDDAFKKIIIVKTNIIPWYTDNGFLIIGLYDFLLKPDLMNM